MCRALRGICFNQYALSTLPQIEFILLQKSQQIESDFSYEMTFGCTNVLRCPEGHSEEHQPLSDINSARMRSIRSLQTPYVFPLQSSRGLILSHLGLVHSQL